MKRILFVHWNESKTETQRIRGSTAELIIDLSIQFAPQTVSTRIVPRSGCRVRRSSRHDASVRDENDEEQSKRVPWTKEDRGKWRS